jgi:hypothetical protein
MVMGVFELDAEGAGHGREDSRESLKKSRIKI